MSVDASADLSVTVEERIRKATEIACTADFLAASYRRSRSAYRQTKFNVVVMLRRDKHRPTVLWGRVEIHSSTTPLGAKRDYRDTTVSYDASVHSALRLRRALGGTSLFFDGANALFAGGILEHRDDGIVVAAGRQRRGLGIQCEPALVRRDGTRAVLVKWLSWRDLSDRAIQHNANFHPTSHHAEALWLHMTRGRAKFAEQRRKVASMPAEALADAQQQYEHASRELATIGDAPVLMRKYVECGTAALYYAKTYGDVVGCDRTCFLFKDDWHELDPRIHFARSCGKDCEILAPLIEIRTQLRARRVVEQQAKEAANNVKRLSRFLKQHGFGPNLEELP
jgi:hypothetical protein